MKNGKMAIAKLEMPKLRSHYVLVKNLVAGINRLDVSCLAGKDFNSGKHSLGFEGVGEVVEFDSACVKTFNVGQRVVYSTAFGIGAFSQYVAIHEKDLAMMPNDTTPDDAATIFKALTAHMLLFRSYELKKTDCIGITTPSGGVGSYVVQWARHYGVKSVAYCLNAQHKSIAIQNGATVVCVEGEEEKFINFAKKHSKTGLGCNVFYDGLGVKGYSLGIKSLAPFGLYNHFGSLTGELKGMSAKHFQTKALFFTTPNTFYSKANGTDFALSVNLICENIKSGILRPNVHRYKFNQLDKAFLDMKSGKEGHKVLIID